MCDHATGGSRLLHTEFKFDGFRDSGELTIEAVSHNRVNGTVSWCNLLRDASFHGTNFAWGPKRLGLRRKPEPRHWHRLWPMVASSLWQVFLPIDVL
jgi:hypothetical protein